MNNWKKIWNKERQINSKVSTLQKLIYADGFDSETGKVSQNNWQNYCDIIYEKLNAKAGDTMLDIGCGSGAFLYPFYKKGLKVSGVDYSKSLLKIAEKYFENAEFFCLEADKLDENNKYDFVVSNSVFFYFESYEYAKCVLEKMSNIANKKIAVLDVADFDKKEECEKYRQGQLGKEEYKKKYEGLGHLYYPKSFFVDFAKEHNYKIEIFDQFMKNYGNAKFRYNVIISKEERQ